MSHTIGTPTMINQNFDANIFMYNVYNDGTSIVLLYNFLFSIFFNLPFCICRDNLHYVNLLPSET